MPPSATKLFRTAVQLPLLILVAMLSAPGHCSDFETLLLEQLEAGGNAQGYQWLQTQEGNYPGDPRYYDWLSRLAMEQGDYRNAIGYLETLIELQPEHMGARLDLVIALQLEGRSHEATERLRELNALVSAFNTLPEQAQRQIIELNRLLIDNRVEVADNPFRVLLSMGAGFDSNANRGADSKTIPVTLPGGVPFDLELTDESLKTEDEFAELGVHLEYGERGKNCRSQSCRLWVAGASTRQYATLGEYDQRHIYIGTRKALKGRYDQEYTLMLQNIVTSELEFARIDEQYIFGIDYRQRVPGLETLTGALKLEVIDEIESEESATLMSTVTVNGNVDLGRDRNFSKTNKHIFWEAAASWHERPDYFAGSTQRWWLSARYPFSVSENWQSSVAAMYRRRQDSDSFSPLFFGTSERSDNEWALTMSVQRLLGRQWLVSSSARYEIVDSNIPLFDVTRFQLAMNVAYQF